MAITRSALLDDIAAIHKVHVNSIKDICSSHYTQHEIRVWTERQSHNTYRKYIEEGGVFIAEKFGQVVGFGHIGEADPASGCDYEVKALYVAPTEVNQGIGSLLLDVLQKEAIKSNGNKLLVKSSKNAEKFYQKLGFVKDECYTTVSCHCEDDLELTCIKMTKLL